MVVVPRRVNRLLCVTRFVQANGALLAEQVVTEYQQTSYEILRFVHQDASGSGVQQTTADGTLAIPNGRTAEYDAMGRNVADPGPYITLDSAPSDGGPGIDLFGNGEGYRPGRRTITVNGWPIPESEFSERFSMYAFNFVFAAARMSTYEVGRWYRTTRTPGIETGVRVLDGVDSGSRGWEQEPTEETRLLSIVYNTSWSFTTLIIPHIAAQDSTVASTEVEFVQTSTDKRGPKHDPNGRFCRELLKKITNLFLDLSKRITELATNPLGLPERDFPGARNRDTREGHGRLISDAMDNLRAQRQKYLDNCGGPPPPSGPAFVPIPQRAPRTAPRSVPLRPAPARGLLPFIMIDPCILWPDWCRSPIT